MSIRTKMKIFARLTMASATPARLIGLRSTMRNPCFGSTCSGGVFSVAMLDLSGFGIFVRVDVCRRVPAIGPFDYWMDIKPVLLAIVMQRHFSVPPGPVHGVHIGIKEYLIEVPDEDRERRQNCFVKMNRG